ncbi:tetratricopeptide repeat protein [Paroceanicella profunda]|uniref:Tetratricopeptide repeat protein n=1 Tax=Paroceanicella profunda TaxID=2579971 RepID=A0A5B8FUM8_9RHOB|nr:tetratricopeptide repeat protein [Paroceanicella profunda]QDL92456.1 tetratricopeptide repeat protein [Paroceanicella profunda]
MRPIPTGFLLLAVLALPVAARANDLDTCADASVRPQTSAQACARVLKSGNLTTAEQARALVNQAMAFAAYDSLGRALQALDDAARRDPRLFAIYPNRAFVHERMGQFDAALADYDRALAMKPSDRDTLFGRGTLYLRRGAPEKAVEDFDAVLRRDGRDVNALYNRGLALAAAGRTLDAVRDFDGVLRAHPDDSSAWLERGRARAQSAPQQALEDVSQAIRLKPEWAEAHVLRGQILDANGQTDAANRDFLRAFELGYQAGWLTERVTRLRGG